MRLRYGAPVPGLREGPPDDLDRKLAGGGLRYGGIAPIVDVGPAPAISWRSSRPPDRRIKRVGSGGTISGYASTFGDVDAFGDVVKPGAFRDTLKEWERRGALPMLLEHDAGAGLVGLWTRFGEDDRGLYVEGKLAVGIKQGADRALRLLEDGAIAGLSICWSAPSSGVYWKDGTRYLRRVNLHEVSLVRDPANPAAQLDGFKGTDAEREICASAVRLQRMIAGAAKEATLAHRAGRPPALVDAIEDLARAIRSA